MTLQVSALKKGDMVPRKFAKKISLFLRERKRARERERESELEKDKERTNTHKNLAKKKSIEYKTKTF